MKCGQPGILLGYSLNVWISLFEGLICAKCTRLNMCVCVQNGNFSTRFSLPSFVKRVSKLTDDQRSAIRKMGFGNLLEMPSHRLRKNLLVELMEKWSCEKLAFELMPCEIPITRMDVALILGLRVVGKPVVLIDEEPFTDIEKEYGAVLWKRKITVASLQSRLDALGGVVNDDFVRTFILFIFGTFLFPNANGKVNSRYLSFLKNLDDFCHYAWGAAVVDDIVSWLNKRKETNIQYVGGCLIFLQVSFSVSQIYHVLPVLEGLMT